MGRHCGSCGEEGHYAKTCKATDTKPIAKKGLDERSQPKEDEFPSTSGVSDQVQHVIPNWHGAWKKSWHPVGEHCEHC